MITCRLKIILAQRAFENSPPTNITELSQMTGLNRSALSNLANNKTTRYDQHVLSALCRVLGVGVGDLLVYIPDQAESEVGE